MSFDSLTLTAVVDELRPLLEGGRIQRLAFPGETELAIEVYTPQHRAQVVLLSANGDSSRVARINSLPARGLETDTPFLLLARKHLRAARVLRIHQPPFERVLQLSLEQRSEDNQHYNLSLIVEVMGRRSNLILLDAAGTILDAARRAPPSRNPRRPILPHLPYVPPPAQERHNPWQVSIEELRTAAAGPSGSLAAFLTGYLAGISPASGRELAYRATGSAETPLGTTDWERLGGAITEFFAPLHTAGWSPTVALDADNQVMEYAPYELRHLSAAGHTVRAVSSIGQAVEAGVHEAPTARAAHDSLSGDRKQLLERLAGIEAAASRRAHALSQQLAESEESNELRRAGELILTHQTEIPPNADQVLLDGATIRLDPGQSPSENAQAYFARYRKRRDAHERVPEMLAGAERTLDHLRQLRALVETADTPEAIRALRREAQAAGGPQPAPTKPARSSRGSRPRTPAHPPFRRFSLGQGFEALVGSSAEGNAYVTFELARPDDLWLHVRGAPGSHVVVRSQSGQSADPPLIERAGNFAAWYSAARNDSTVEVDIVLRRNVRKIHGAPPGLVRYASERTIRVKPGPPSSTELAQSANRGPKVRGS